MFTATATATVNAPPQPSPQHTRPQRNEPLSEEDKSRLDRNRVNLVMSIEPTSLYPYLRQGEALTEDEEDQIKVNDIANHSVNPVRNYVAKCSGGLG